MSYLLPYHTTCKPDAAIVGRADLEAEIAAISVEIGDLLYRISFLQDEVDDLVCRREQFEEKLDDLDESPGDGNAGEEDRD